MLMMLAVVIVVQERLLPHEEALKERNPKGYKGTFTQM
jgi:hypothetical protein